MAEEDIYGSGKKEVNILKWTGREENNRKYWEKRERKVSGQELTLWWYRRKDLYTHYLLKDNEMINQITMDIIKHAKDGETIYSLAKRIGFAYSAVYRWINVLESYDVLHVIRKGNKNIIKINKNEIYNRCTELNKSVGTMEKDKVFWNIIKKAHLEVRFVQSTAVVIWTQGSYITGDFTDRVYFLEVAEKDTDSLKELFKKHEIFFTEKDMIEERPLVKIITKKSFAKERKNSLPIMPLQELVSWCKKLYLDSILEQLDELYHLNLKEKYAEIRTNR